MHSVPYVLRNVDYLADTYPNHKWVFLGNGNPTSAPTEYLVKILRYVKSRFKKLERLSAYSKALDIVRKTDEELMQLKEAGLDIVYMGLESGSKTILRLMKKGTNDRTIIQVGKRILNAGIKLSLYIILGLGSYEYSEEHVREMDSFIIAEASLADQDFRDSPDIRANGLME